MLDDSAPQAGLDLAGELTHAWHSLIHKACNCPNPTEKEAS
jgi:hypothetical protein